MTRKTILQCVGHFRELGYNYDAAPSIVDARGKRVATNKDKVVQYLRAGKCYIVFTGIVKDYFEPSAIIGTRSTRTDGTYTWPNALAYYVERYDIALPEHFERFMEDRGWQIRDDIDLLSLDLPLRPY